MKMRQSQCGSNSAYACLLACSGCVNRLCWNDAGTRIASGSDDTTVCLFDAASGKRDVQFQTGHRRNILSVKFLPCTNDQVELQQQLPWTRNQ